MSLHLSHFMPGLFGGFTFLFVSNAGLAVMDKMSYTAKSGFSPARSSQPCPHAWSGLTPKNRMSGHGFQSPFPWSLFRRWRGTAIRWVMPNTPVRFAGPEPLHSPNDRYVRLERRLEYPHFRPIDSSPPSSSLLAWLPDVWITWLRLWSYNSIWRLPFPEPVTPVFYSLFAL